MGLRSTVRAFLAFDPDPATRVRLLREMPRLQEAVPGVRWVRPEGIHLTVRFLGQTEVAALRALEPLVLRAVPLCPAFEAPFREPALFPGGSRPRIVSLGIELPEPAFRLQRACEEAARAVGFEPEERPFRPHLTLGRFVTPGKPKPLPRGDWGSLSCSELVLFESQLGRGGSVYTSLQRFPLGRS
jgi:2'-5' RNA ligase